MKHKSLREALTHLRRFPRVDIYVPLVTTITRISAIWRTRDRYGLHFDVYNGPAILIGAPYVLGLDGGESELESAIEFTDRGFIVTRGNDQVEVVYRSSRDRPWPKQITAS